MWMTAVSMTAGWFWRCGVIKRLGQFSFGESSVPDPSGHHYLVSINRGTCALGRRRVLALGVAPLQDQGAPLGAHALRARLRRTPVANLWSGENVVNLIANVSPSWPNPWDIGSSVRPFSLPGRSSNPYLAGEDGIAVPFIPLSCLRCQPYGPDRRTLDQYLWLQWTRRFRFVVCRHGITGDILLVRFPVHLLRDPLVALVTVAAALLGIYMVDCLINSYVNIVYVSLAGGLVGVTPMQCGISLRACIEPNVCQTVLVSRLNQIQLRFSRVCMRSRSRTRWPW